jgi:protein phosphatase
MLSLRALHRNHYLHQDIKPDNIMLTEQGVQLIDFGSLGSLVFKGKSAQPPGSLQYAAPEYFSKSAIGIASDLFSFAVVVYEMLTGKLPFSAQQIASESRYLQFVAPHEHCSELPVGLVDVFNRAFCVNMNSRYQSISEFVADLDPVRFEKKSNIHEPLIAKNPVLFWKGLSVIFAFIIVVLFIQLIQCGGQS